MAIYPIDLKAENWGTIRNQYAEIRGAIPGSKYGFDISAQDFMAVWFLGRYFVNPAQGPAKMRAWLQENKPAPKPQAEEVKPGQLTFLDPSEFGAVDKPQNKPDEIRAWIRAMRAAQKRAARAGPWGSQAMAKSYQTAFARVMRGVGKKRQEYKTRVVEDPIVDLKTMERIPGERSDWYLEFWIKGV